MTETRALRPWLEAEAERTLARVIDAEERGLDGLVLAVRQAAFDHATAALDAYEHPKPCRCGVMPGAYHEPWCPTLPDA